jgi:hypothetical protein
MLPTPQFAAVTAGCDHTSEDEEKRSLIPSLPTLPATLATPQSAAVAAGCDRPQPRAVGKVLVLLTHLDRGR